VASVYLSGILTAWCLTQLALGVFFGYAYFVLRRERDIGIFALACMALAYHSASSARAHLAESLLDRHIAVSSVVAAALLAAVINLHFVAEFVGLRRRRALVAVAYTVTALFELYNWGWDWWRPATESVASSVALGMQLLHWRAEPTLIGKLGFGWVGCEILASVVLLFGAWRSRNKQAGYALIGAIVLVSAAANDMLLSSGFFNDTLFLVPHAFMIYAFAVTSMLVARQRATVERLARAESNLEKAAEDLRVSHAELEEVHHELMTKRELAAVGELAAAIAHEVRNPLAIIDNAVAGLRRPSSRAGDQETLLGIVAEESQRLNRLVTDLLRFARPTSLKRASVDLPELVQGLGSVVRDGYEVELDVGADAPTRVDGDANLLRVALESLLTNACQAMPEGGVVRFGLTADTHDDAPAVRLDVVDTGCGMTEATRAKALKPFFTTRPSGTGLGLPIVERVVTAHGGRIELESEKGVGTTVRLHLPLAASRSLPPRGRPDGPVA
jgi:signal transduction histidine kinase